MTPPIVPIVVTLHAEEAALLWLRRDLAVTAPHYRLQDLAELEARLDAHLDGLRIAGDAGWEICLEELKWEEPEELFPAAILAFESGQSERIQTVLERAAGNPLHARPVISALGWLNDDRADYYIGHLLQASEPSMRCIGLAAAAARRRDPGKSLRRALEDADATLRTRAMRTVGELGLQGLLPAVRAGLNAADEQEQYWAAWTAARWECNLRALEVLQASVGSQVGDPRAALQLVLGRLDRAEASAWLERLAGDERTVRAATIGRGIAGRPKVMEGLLELMKIPALARVAGEAFSMITGVDLAADKLEGLLPTGFQAGPSEDPCDEDVGLDVDENLAWPDPDKLAAWWQRRREGFDLGTRYLCGQPLTEPWLRQVLRDGYQRQRAAAATALCLAQADQPVFHVRDVATRQQLRLG